MPNRDDHSLRITPSIVCITSDPVANDISRSNLQRVSPILYRDPIRHAYLGEFRLPVCSQILIPKAARKLIISGNTASHENLFILLRTLRESICHPTPPCRHKELASTFRSGLKEQRGFNLHKSGLALLKYFFTYVSGLPSKSEGFPQPAIRPQLQVPLFCRIYDFRGQNDVSREFI